jgi:hypothetical protein
MDSTDIFNVIKNNWRLTDAAKDSESTTMIRLSELHVKAGSARQQQSGLKTTIIYG